MSDFSFNSTGASRSSSFQKLVSGRVAKTSEEGAASSAGRSQEARIFNTVGPSPVSPEASARISALEAAVTNLNRSSASLEQLAVVNAEVASTNSEASKVQVRDVQSAVELANDISARVLRSQEIAKEAHDGIDPQRAQRFLS